MVDIGSGRSTVYLYRQCPVSNWLIIVEHMAAGISMQD